jgi:hypothetical protein
MRYVSDTLRQILYLPHPYTQFCNLNIASEHTPRAFPCKDIFRTLLTTRLRIAIDKNTLAQLSLVDVRAKFAAEEANSLHIGLPRLFAMFINGLFMTHLSWVIYKSKSCILIDESTQLHPVDTGDINDYIPTTGFPRAHEENPLCSTAPPPITTLSTLGTCVFLIHTKIVHHSDDIYAAFCQILYHPKLALA